MHILESYASNARAKIAKPILIPKFYPLPFDKYITIQGDAKFNSRKYSWFSEVLLLLKPYLEPLNIKIVQIGSKDDNRVPFIDLDLCGKTSWRQSYDVIRGSLLHIGPDSANIHISSVFGTKIVGLYSNMYCEQSGPYWTDKKDRILLQAPLQGKKPSYSADESPKTINLIKPEVIAQAALELLNINETISRKSLYFGENFNNLYIESIPDSLVNPNFYPEVPLYIRYDFIQESDLAKSNLYKQVSLRKCVIVTDKELNINALQQLKSNIPQIMIKIKGAEQKTIVESIEKTGIPYVLITDLEKDDLDKIKLHFINFKPIIKIPKISKESLKLDSQLSENTAFKTTKFIMSNNKVFASKAHWLNNEPMSNILEQQKIGNFLNNDIFWEEAEFFYIFN